MIPSQPIKKPPVSSLQPFPWRCHECGADEVRPARTDYETTLNHDGRLHTFLVREIEIPKCGKCGTLHFTEQVDREIRLAFRRHAHFLLPTEIKTAIEQLSVQQKEVAQHLGVAEESLSRWINGSQIQSRSMDTLLRIYFGFPLVREALSSEKGRAELGLVELPIPAAAAAAAR